MNNEGNKNTPQRRGPRRGPVFEKPKNFSMALKRLLKELGKFRVLILISILLAGISALLSIITPNRLSSLTDEIAKGLVVNTDNIKVLSEKIMSNTVYSDIEVDGIKITYSEQMEFVNLYSKYNEDSDKSKIYEDLNNLPASIKKVIEPHMSYNLIKEIALILVIIYVVSALFNYLEQIIMTTVSNNFAKTLRTRITKKINRLPLKYFDNHQTGDVMSRVTNDVDQVAQSMNNSIASLVTNITLLLGSLFMMFYTNSVMALTAVLSSIIGFVFMAFVLKKSQKYFLARQKELGNLNGHIEEVYSGLNIVKTYNAKELVNKKFDELNEKVYEANRKSQFLAGLMHPMMGFIGNLGYVCVCIVGAMLASKGTITFGVIVAFITYVRLFTTPLSQIAQSINMLQSTTAASERIFEFIDEEEQSNEDNFKELELSKVKGEIEFKNVTFRYDGNEKDTIKNFSAKVKPGEKIAIVGPTGAGKTTMVNLLMKFYDIKSGDILIDGVSIKELKRDNIHRLFTMVLQDTWLFNGTVKENIKYNRNVSDNKIKDICKVVGLDHFIRTLPNSYNTVLSDNDSVSSGQRQLLTIARGMSEDSPFLILDEATSNVDTRTEELVQKAMDGLTEGKTSFIIAHRLSTIKNADLILVMKDGNIIEQGNHEELMKQRGFYAELYNSQFEL